MALRGLGLCISQHGSRLMLPSPGAMLSAPGPARQAKGRPQPAMPACMARHGLLAASGQLAHCCCGHGWLLGMLRSCRHACCHGMQMHMQMH